MLRNFIKINLLFIFIITKNDGMDPEKDTIEYFLRRSGAFGTTNSLIQEDIQNNPNVEINSSTPIQANPFHPFYNQNIQPPQFNPNFHQQNMFSPSSTNQFPYSSNFQYFGGHYPNNQHFIPNHPSIYSGDSSHSGTVQNLPENFQVNQGFPSVYNTNLLPTQQASSSSFNNIIEGTTKSGKRRDQQRFRDQEKEDINSIKDACNNNTLIELPTNFGDYWYFLKNRIYKNFKYQSCYNGSRSSAYYRCKDCRGALSYKEGFEIKENQKHSCVEIGN
ncbi:unnamed protein product [Meloidogyne enterolobii]|uniref:Uncharacterized protein n=1 Tax=Meloidogyne enterolobii TaxID=390850 RepID=A0ACB0ZDG3_MELEN